MIPQLFKGVNTLDPSVEAGKFYPDWIPVWEWLEGILAGTM